MKAITFIIWCAFKKAVNKLRCIHTGHDLATTNGICHMIQLDSAADCEKGMNSTASLCHDLEQFNQWQCVLTRSRLIHTTACCGWWNGTVGVFAVRKLMSRRVVSGESLTAFLIFLKKREKSCREFILASKKKAMKH